MSTGAHFWVAKVLQLQGCLAWKRSMEYYVYWLGSTSNKCEYLLPRMPGVGSSRKASDAFLRSCVFLFLFGLASNAYGSHADCLALLFLDEPR